MSPHLARSQPCMRPLRSRVDVDAVVYNPGLAIYRYSILAPLSPPPRARGLAASALRPSRVVTVHSLPENHLCDPVTPACPPVVPRAADAFCPRRPRKYAAANWYTAKIHMSNGKIKGSSRYRARGCWHGPCTSLASLLSRCLVRAPRWARCPCRASSRRQTGANVFAPTRPGSACPTPDTAATGGPIAGSTPSACRAAVEAPPRAPARATWAARARSCPRDRLASTGRPKCHFFAESGPSAAPEAGCRAWTARRSG